MKHISARTLVAGSIICSVLNSCAPFNDGVKVIPSLEYARSLGGGGRQDIRRAQALSAPIGVAKKSASAPTQLHQVGFNGPETPRARFAAEQGDIAAQEPVSDGGVVTNIAPSLEPAAEFEVHPSTGQNIRDYNGALSLGDPGVSASLWQESRGETNLFHDFRAWQPMDLITINVVEKSEGKKKADTDVKTESTFQTAIQNFFGYENDVKERNLGADGKTSKVDLANLINASASSEFKGEGETGRTDTLKAQISAMVVEVLPGGLLRIEGERIISMNNEEQIMVLTGLARTRDISSDNQIDSVKIANLRIDYFGRGALGNAQYGGWLGNLLRMLWPF